MPSLECRAVLFDLDGVLVDSRGVVEAVWRRWAAERGRDPLPFLAAAHGRRTSETLRAVAPEMDVAAETAALDLMEERETDGLVAVSGAPELLASLPPGSWGIVTSGGPTVATLRLAVAGLPVPDVLVTGTDVRRGKPDPEGYLAGAVRLGMKPEDCLVVEDAPAGIAAARTAGARVLALEGTFSAGSLSGALDVLPGLDRLTIVAGPGTGWLTARW